VYTGCWWGNLRKRYHLEGADGMIILRWSFRKWDWIDLAQDRERWREVVNVVMKLRGSVKCGEFLD
jgi:hypothetical protein